MLAAFLIFLVTIVLVIWQPRGLGIGWSAMLGAAMSLLSGLVHPGDILSVWQIVWNATATFIAIIIVSLLTPAPEKEVQDLVDHVRYPVLAGDIETRAA